MTDNLAVIKGCSELKNLRVDLQITLAKHAATVDLLEGERLWSMGERSDHIYLILSGFAALFMVTEDGKNLFISFVIEKHLVGEATVIENCCHQNELIVMDSATFLKIPKKIFLQCLDDDPKFCRDFLRISNRKFLFSLNHLYHLQSADIEERMLRILRYLVNCAGQTTENRVTFPFNISQQALASFIGISRPALNKLLVSWKQKGVLEASYGKLIIHRPDQLFI